MKTTYEMLPVEDLKVDTYNREINTPHGKMIANNFNQNLMGVIVVSLRDGVYHVVDGQHRTYAARINKIPSIMCQVITGLTREEEAKTFKKLNKNRKTISAVQYFVASVEEKEEKAIEIRDIIEEVGFKVGAGSWKYTIRAINAIESIYGKYGKVHLKKSLRIIKKIWDGEINSSVKDILFGIADFVNLYEIDPFYNEEALVDSLKAIEPTKILREAKGNTIVSNRRTAMAMIILKYYNNRRTKKLPNKLGINDLE